MTSTLPDKYTDPEYVQAHRDTFQRTPKHPIPKVLPPGISEDAFAEALRMFVSVVGEKAVFVDEALSDYIDPYDIWEADESKRKVPSAAVCPASTDELREVLKVANKSAIPLWTFSRGKNLGYGGPSPCVRGSVALDLHRMNKIIEVNERFAYAVVEPGVTFLDLYNYCVERKLKLWPSTASLGWGSVIGNTLDRGMGFGINFAHHQAMAGLEIMLADGDVVRTGQWGISNSPSAHTSQYTYGPSVEGLFVQSNLGVVTKMSIWLAAQPEAYMSCAFRLPAFEDLEVLVDCFHEFRRDGLITNCVWVSGLIEGLCVAGRRGEFWDGPGPIPDARMDELQRELGIPQWMARWGLYGPRRVVQAQFDEIKAVLARRAPTGETTGVLFVGGEGEGSGGGGVDALTVPPEHGSMFVGVPSMWSLPLINWTLPVGEVGRPAHGDYAPVIPSSGKLVLEWMRALKPICEANGLELMGDFFMHERHIVMMNMFSWNQDDPEQKKCIDRLWHGMYEESKKRGYGMYRAHVQHMDIIADLNDFNDHAYRRFVEKIKDAVDPNGILSPGKSGIWPSSFRHLKRA